MNKTIITGLILMALGNLGVSNTEAHNSSLEEKCASENITELTQSQIEFRDQQDPISKEHDKLAPVVELGAFHLGGQIKGFEGRHVRTRYWSLAPKGVIKLHRHNERPALVHILSGSVTEIRKESLAVPKKKY